MKYFAAIALIFGLFAFAQAMPVEESSEKRFFPGLSVGFIINTIKGFCDRLTQSNPNPLILRACSCVKAGSGAVGGLGDESVPEQKRFLFNLSDVGKLIQDAVKALCANPAPGFHADTCYCITGQ